MTESERVTLKNGVKIYPFESFEDFLSFIDGKQKILMAINAGKIGRSNTAFKALINDNIGYADGYAAVLALNKKGAKKAVKIPGCELWLKIIDKYQNASFYFVGGKQDVIEATIKKLKNIYADINIVGYRNGYIKNSEERQMLLDDIKNKKPEFVFVAMGSPNQELLMQDMMSVNPAMYQGLGGSFDVFTDNFERAPRWFIEHNLEGVYRALHRFNDKKIRYRLFSDLLIVIKIKMGLL